MSRSEAKKLRKLFRKQGQAIKAEADRLVREEVERRLAMINKEVEAQVETGFRKFLLAQINPRPRWIPRWAWLRLAKVFFKDNPDNPVLKIWA